MGRGTGSFKISVGGATELGRDLAMLATDLKDFRPAWDLLAPRLMTAVRNIIASRGGLVNHQWSESLPDYRKRKARQGYGAAPLVRTGTLISKIGVLSRRLMSMKFGVRLPWAPSMNFGCRAKNIAPKPFLFSKDGGTSEEIRRAAHEEIARYVDVLIDRMRSMRAAA